MSSTYLEIKGNRHLDWDAVPREKQDWVKKELHRYGIGEYYMMTEKPELWNKVNSLPGFPNQAMHGLLAKVHDDLVGEMWKEDGKRRAL